MDLDIREFRATIEAYVSKSELPWEVKRLCLQEILVSATNEANERIRVQLEKRKEEENEQSVQPVVVGE